MELLKEKRIGSLGQRKKNTSGGGKERANKRNSWEGSSKEKKKPVSVEKGEKQFQKRGGGVRGCKVSDWERNCS